MQLAIVVHLSAPYRRLAWTWEVWDVAGAAPLLGSLQRFPTMREAFADASAERALRWGSSGLS